MGQRSPVQPPRCDLRPVLGLFLSLAGRPRYRMADLPRRMGLRRRRARHQSAALRRLCLPSTMMLDKEACHFLLPFWSLAQFTDGTGDDRLVFRELLKTAILCGDRAVQLLLRTAIRRPKAHASCPRVCRPAHRLDGRSRPDRQNRPAHGRSRHGSAKRESVHRGRCMPAGDRDQSAPCIGTALSGAGRMAIREASRGAAPYCAWLGSRRSRCLHPVVRREAQKRSGTACRASRRGRFGAGACHGALQEKEGDVEADGSEEIVDAVGPRSGRRRPMVNS